MGRVLQIDTPEWLVPFLEPARTKGAHGGRGSGKSHGFGDNLLERHQIIQGCHSVCAREVQKSLKQSAKRLLEMKLAKYRQGEAQGWKVYTDCIKTPGDGLIIFQGLQDHTVDSIKSLEEFHTIWMEEAQTISENSLQLVRPTIRAPGSEIWATWNPRRRVDAIDVALRGEELPTNAIVRQVNWQDNPWFPDELEQERLDCLRLDPDSYGHIWEGGYQTITKGAYYAQRLAEAKQQGRVGFMPPDPLFKYRVFTDIGGTGAKSDAFTMWVAQFIGREIRVLNYYEAVGQDIAAHANWLDRNGYTPSNTGIWLPHDGATKDRVFSVSYESAFKGVGYKVEVVPNQGAGAAMSRIEAGRKLFPSMTFNESTTEVGREALGYYHEKWDDKRNTGLGPDHDWASHGADSFGLMAVVYKEPKEKRIPRHRSSRLKDPTVGY